MLGIIVIFVVAMVALYSLFASEKDAVPVPNTIGRRMDRLWIVAQSSLRDRRYLKAEKALLTILKLDKKNAAAYNHLGILYSRQKEYKDAIECFEIASSIKPTPTTLHNLGLVYYETENYEKAAVALDSALSVDDSLAARHIAYAKVLEKLDRHEEAIERMELALKMEPSEQSLKLMREMYNLYGRDKDAKRIEKRLDNLLERQKSKSRVKRPSRVVY